MPRARPQYAAGFYRGASESWIRNVLRKFDPPQLASPPVAAVVPHAGWEFSGAVAAKVFQTIKTYRVPNTFILLGTVHRGIPENAVYPNGSWSTPFGDVEIDRELADRLAHHAGKILRKDESAHDYEHSIEVQMPFIKYFFPNAKAVPISVLPDQRAPALGERIGEFIRKNQVDTVVVGTTDLTHYGDAYSFAPGGYGPPAYEWMKRNDARILELAAGLKAEEIVPEAVQNQNACGAGALAATVAAARKLGCASGVTLEYTTSFDVRPDRQFQMAVGYAGMVFCPS